ncbi:hypothetical protein FRB94_004685 [Tulasnella sp. JGI-2019a]|nr:hypothetical protein FRB94_004685 [Tulasnella sp. JGI-2019a]KAG9006337.1 hypothetical protein FRB93_008826 [Tulasnella sp. JGI-2019a]KAG9038005.1 hypothetical protein FRB95_003398 [Tulasnella sp. JGI-2019a]
MSVATGNYTIVPRDATEMCLDVWGGSEAPGTPVKLDHQGNPALVNQIFQVVQLGNWGTTSLEPTLGSG